MSMRARVSSALVVFVVSTGLFGLFVPRLYTADDLQYAGVIRTAVTGVPVYHPVGGPPFPAPAQDPEVPVNPRYALDWPTAVGAVRIAEGLGWHEIDAIIAMRVLMGALGVTFFFQSLLLLSRRLSVATLASACLATSTVYWTYSTHMDESVGMLAFTCVALFFLTRQFVSGSSRSDGLVPFFLGLASLYNLTALITAVPAGIVWGLNRAGPAPWLRLRAVARFGLIYVATATLGVAGALALTGSASDLVSASYWRESLFVGRPEYGFTPLRDTFETAASFARALVSYPPVGGDTTLREYFTDAPSGARIAALTYYGAAGLLSLVPLVLLLRYRGHDRMRALTGFGVAWFAASLAFAWWWDPSYIKYFVLPILSWSFLLGLALIRLSDSSRRAFHAGLAGTALAAATLFALNFSTVFLPQREESANEWIVAARELRKSSPNALFVSAGQHPLDFHITYFADRDVISAGLVRYASDSDADVARVVEEHVRQHVRVGGAIYVYGLESLTSEERRMLLELLPGNSLRPAWRFHDVIVYRRTGS